MNNLATWQPVNLIQFLLVIQCLFFGLFLFSQDKGRGLAIFLLVMSLHMGLNIFEEVTRFSPIPKLTHGFGFLYGPSIWWFVREMAFRDHKFRFKHLVHILPFAIALPLPLLFKQIGFLLGPAIVFSMSAYLISSFLLIRRYHQVILQTQSNAANYRLNWLKYFLILLVIISVADFTRHFFVGNLPLEEHSSYLLVLVSLFGGVSYLLFKALKQSDIFEGIKDSDSVVFNSATEKLDEASEHESQKSYEQLVDFIQQNKSYLDPRLTVEQLSKLTGIPARQVSKVVNQFGRRNFSEFINLYRVKHACQLMKSKQGEGRKLLDILMSSGFNSKSSFNAMFKKEMNLTPSQYRNSLKERI